MELQKPTETQKNQNVSYLVGIWQGMKDGSDPEIERLQRKLHAVSIVHFRKTPIIKFNFPIRNIES